MDEMSGWDPMGDDFHNSTVNSYDTGAGANLPPHLQPALFKKGPENFFKIYVRGLTTAHNEQAVRNIFSKFGPITHVIMDKSKHYWAIIIFQTQEAANDAIQEMNDHPEFNFKVTYARDRISAQPPMNDFSTTTLSRPAGDVEGTSISVSSLMNNYRNQSVAANHGHSQTMNHSVGANYSSSQTPRLLPSVAFPVDMFPMKKMNQMYLNNDPSRKTSMSENGDYGVVPICRSKKCGKETYEICSKCEVPFCSMKCSFDAGPSEHQRHDCILVASTISSKTMMNRPAMGNYLSFRNPLPANVGPRNNAELQPLAPNVRPGHGHINGAPLNDDSRPHPALASQHEYQNGFRTNNVQKREFVRNDNSSSYGRDASADNDACGRGPNSSQKREDWDSRRNGYSDSRRSQPGESTFSKSREHTSSDSQKPSLEDKMEDSWENKHGCDDQRGRDYNRRNDQPRDGKPLNKDRQDDGKDRNNKSSVDENRSRDDNRRNDRLRDGKPPHKGRQEDSRDDDNSGWNDNRSRDENRNRNDNRKNEDGYGRSDHHRRDHDRNSDDNRKMSRIRVGGSGSQKSSSRDGFDEKQSSRISERNVASAQHGRVELVEAQSQPDNQIGFSQPLSKECEKGNTSDRTNRTGRTSDISEELKKSPLSKTRDGPKNESSKVTFQPIYLESRTGLEPNVKVQVSLNEVIIDQMPGVCTVRIVSETKMFQALMADLQVESSFPPLELEQGKKCVVYRDDEWMIENNVLQGSQIKVMSGVLGYRGVITTVDPVKVRVVDTGYNSVVCDVNKLKGLPEKYCKVGPFAYRVQFENASTAELKKLESEKIPFEIIPIKKETTATLVELVKPPFDEKLERARLIRDSKPASPQRSGSQNTPALSFTLRSGVPEEVVVTEIKDENYFYIVKPNIIAEMIEMTNAPEVTKSLPALDDISVDKTCLAFWVDAWYRARIISTDPLMVYFIDFGNSATVEPAFLKSLPEELMFINPLTKLVRFAEGTVATNRITADGTYKLIPVQLEADTKAMTVKFENTTSQLDIPEVLSVIPTVPLSDTETYVCKQADLPKLEEMSKIPHEPLKSELKVGLVCHANYDSTWCRAKITSLSPLKIHFMDYGNTEDASIADLLEIPEEWQQTPPLAFKIKLRTKLASELYQPITISKKPNEETWDIESDVKNVIPASALEQTTEGNINSVDGTLTPPLIFQKPGENVLENVNSITDVESEVESVSLPLVISEKEQTKVNKSKSNSTPALKRVKEGGLLNGDDESFSSVNSSASYFEYDLRENESVTVTVKNFVEPGVYGVILKQKIKKYVALTNNLKQRRDVLLELHNPQMGEVCAVVQDKKIWRGKITCLDPYIVESLDNGYMVDMFGPDELRALPEKLKAVEPLCFRIALMKSDDLLIVGDDYLIKPVERIEPNFWWVVVCSGTQVVQVTEVGDGASSLTDDESASPEVSPCTAECKATKEELDRVEVEQECVPTEANDGIFDGKNWNFAKKFVSNIPPFPNIVHSISRLSTETEATFVPSTECNKIMFVGMLSPGCLKNTLVNMCNKMTYLKADPTYKPKIGDLIAVHPENYDTWVRGVVLYEPTPLRPLYSVITVDFGTVLHVSEVARLPEAFTHVPRTSVCCKVIGTVENEDEPVELYEKYVCSIKSVDQEKYIFRGFMYKVIDSESNDEPETIYEVEFTEWKPVADHVGIKYVTLETGDRVKIQMLKTSNEVYITPSDDDSDEAIVGILDATTIAGRKSDNLREEPFKKQIVNVYYQESYWRGEVLKKIGDLYSVRLIDLGLKVTVRMADMKSLDESLKLLVRTAVPVTFKDVRITDINEKEKQIIQLNHEYELVVEDDSSVTLKFIEKVAYNVEGGPFANLNEYLNDLLTPNWMLMRLNDTEYAPPIFEHKDMKIEQWDVDSIMSLYVGGLMGNCDDENNATFLMCNNYGAVKKHHKKMNLDARLQEYCEVCTEPYVPKENQICIAKSSAGIWERAECAHNPLGGKIQLNFIDSGRCESVWNTEIRPIAPEFVIYPMPVNITIVSNPEGRDLSPLVGKEVTCYIMKRTNVGEFEVTILDMEEKLPESTKPKRVIPETEIEF